MVVRPRDSSFHSIRIAEVWGYTGCYVLQVCKAVEVDRIMLVEMCYGHDCPVIAWW